MNPCGLRRLALMLFAVGIGAGVGCDRTSSGDKSATPAAKPSTAPTTQPGAGDLSAIQRMVTGSQGGQRGNSRTPTLPPGHPPVPGMSPTASRVPNSPAATTTPGPTATRPSAPEFTGPSIPLTWDVPSYWRVVNPTSTMRLAQYEIPGAEGHSAGSITVSHFPGSGGTVEANIVRWISQLLDANGDPVDPATAQQQTFEAGGHKVHLVEVSGYLRLPQSGNLTYEEYRLVGGIVEMPDGNWFFKGLGPDITMLVGREGFVQMLRSVREGQPSTRAADSPGPAGTP